MSSSHWRTLPVTTQGSPPLLVSFSAGESSYHVRVTDLANVWTEELDRRNICMRGWQENTFIDPSDTPENMVRFLSYLRSALDDSHPGHGATSARLSGGGSAAGAGDDDDGLRLDVTCELPGLGKLQWPMFLKKAPAAAIATELVLPLVRAQSTRMRQVESLAVLVRHKDGAISRLLDAAEANRVGLESIFPVLAGKRKATRALAEDHVKGIAPFDRGKWSTGLADAGAGDGSGGGDDGPAELGALVEAVFGIEGLGYVPNRDRLDGVDLEGWWKDYRGSEDAPEKPKAKNPADEARSKPPLPPPDEEDGDDEFQVQTTPSGGRAGRKQAPPPSKPPADDEITADDEPSPPPPPPPPHSDKKKTPTKKPARDKIPEDSIEEESDGEFQRQATPPRNRGGTKPPAPRKLPSRIGGATGGSNKAPTKRTPSPEDESETASEAEPDDDDPTASFAEDSLPPSSPKPGPKPASAPAPTPRRVRGRIGGTKPTPAPAKSSSPPPPPPPPPRAADEDVDEATDDPSRSATEPDPEAMPPLRRMGKIGGGGVGGKIGGVAAPSSSDASTATRGRSREPSAPKEAGREETPQERADRRRREIKEERDRKAAAGPAKKKRKF